MNKADKFNKWFNIFILAGMTVAMVAMTVYKLKTSQTGHAMLIIAAFGSLMGVLSTVSSANGKIITFLFGLFDVSIYGVMCFIGGKYGNAALHLLYFLPMQFVGFWQWRKRGAGTGQKIKARRLKGRQWLMYGGIFLVGVSLAYFILGHIAGPSSASGPRVDVLMDSLSMMCNILGQLLMSMAFMDQWFFWIGVNVTTVIMWTLTLRQDPGSTYALIYVIKYGFYLLNSLNGMRIWTSLSKEGIESK